MDNSKFPNYMEEIKLRIEARKKIIEKNLQIKNKENEEVLSVKLDSNVKKTTNFIKRLKNITEQQKDALLKDLSSLNLTKYIEEMASSLFENKFKMSDVPLASLICLQIYKKYPTFTAYLYSQIQKALLLTNLSLNTDDLQQMNISKFRVDLRLSAELIASHMFVKEDPKSKGFNLIYNTFKHIVDADKEKFVFLNIVTSFCKYFAEEYLGIYDEVALAEHGGSSPRFSTFSTAENTALKTLLVDIYFKMHLITRLKRDFEELFKINKTNRAIFRNKGELHPDRIEKFRELDTTFQKLLASARAFSLAVRDNNQSFPAFNLIPYDSMLDEEDAGADMKWLLEEINGDKAKPSGKTSLDENSEGNSGTDESGTTGKYSKPWWDEDEDILQFYCDMPNIKQLIPGLAFKETTSSAKETKEINETSKETAADKSKVVVVVVAKEPTELTEANLEAKNKDAKESLDQATEFETLFRNMSTVDKNDTAQQTAVTKNPNSTTSSSSATLFGAGNSAHAAFGSAYDDDADTMSSLSTLGINSDLDELDFDEGVESGNDAGAAKYYKDKTHAANEKITRHDPTSATATSNTNSAKKRRAARKHSSAAAVHASSINMLLKLKMDAFLEALPTRINRDLIDEAAIEFLTHLNNKINRKRLTAHLLSVPRNRADLLPFYSRFVAILSQCVPDFAKDLSKKLYSSFRYQLKKKDQVNLEVKLKIVRFLSELTKFNMFPAMDMCYCVFLLINDFKYHSIEMVCAILENCGRYLVKSPETKRRAKFLLENLRRKKNALPLYDDRFATQIENAYYYCLPDEGLNQGSRQAVVSERVYEQSLNDHQRFMRQLLYVEIPQKTTSLDRIVKTLRKFSWDNTTDQDGNSIINNMNSSETPTQELIDTLPVDDAIISIVEKEPSAIKRLTSTEEFFVKTALDLAKFRFDDLPNLANVVSSLSIYRGDTIGIAIIDDLLEFIRAGVATLKSFYGPTPSLGGPYPDYTKQYSPPTNSTLNERNSQQRLLSAVKLLGEFYNYRLIDTAFLFKIMYTLIAYSSLINDQGEGPLIPPVSDVESGSRSINLITSTNVLSFESPEYTFSIRLVCLLLETCGMYFDRGSFKKRLDIFLTYFQRYFLEKRSWVGWNITPPEGIESDERQTLFPIELQNYYRDVLELLRPKLKLYQNYGEAQDAVNEIESEYMDHLRSIYKLQQEQDQTYFEGGDVQPDNNFHNSSWNENVNGHWQDDEEPPYYAIHENNFASYDDNNNNNNVNNNHSHETIENYSGGETLHNDSMDTSDSYHLYEDASYDVQSYEANQPLIKAHEVLENEIIEESMREYAACAIKNIEDQELIKNQNTSELSPYDSISPKFKNCQEDEEFVKSLDSIISESIMQRAQDTVKLSNLDISLPANIRSKASKLSSKLIHTMNASNLRRTSDSRIEDIDPAGPTPTPDKVMDFVLVVKRGNKPQFKDIQIPFDTKLANRIKSLEEAERKEKEEMKKLTLDNYRLQEEEERKNQMIEHQKTSQAHKTDGTGKQHGKTGPAGHHLLQHHYKFHGKL